MSRIGSSGAAAMAPRKRAASSLDKSHLLGQRVWVPATDESLAYEQAEIVAVDGAIVKVLTRRYFINNRCFFQNRILSLSKY